MTTAKAVNDQAFNDQAFNNYASRYLQPRQRPLPSSRRPASAVTRWTDRLIAVLAVTVSFVVIGAFLEELVWAALAAGTVFALGMDN